MIFIPHETIEVKAGQSITLKYPWLHSGWASESFLRVHAWTQVSDDVRIADQGQTFVPPQNVAVDIKLRTQEPVITNHGGDTHHVTVYRPFSEVRFEPMA